MSFEPRQHSAHDKFRSSLSIACFFGLEIRKPGGIVSEHAACVNPLPGRQKLLGPNAGRPIEDGLLTGGTSGVTMLSPK
jgi:hypothetical protein